MHFSKLSPTCFFTASVLISFATALPTHNALENTPAGPDGIYTEIHTESILPHSQRTSRPNFGSKFGEHLLPREQSADNVHVEKAGLWAEASKDISRLPRTVDKYGNAEVWVEAQFDARAEVADGRGAKKGKWRSAANQFLPW
jgi:hypothetical protein